MLEGFSDFGVFGLSQRYGRVCQGQARPGPGVLSNSLVQVQVQVHGKAEQSKQARPGAGCISGAQQVWIQPSCLQPCVLRCAASLLVRTNRASDEIGWMGGWMDGEMDGCLLGCGRASGTLQQSTRWRPRRRHG